MSRVVGFDTRCLALGDWVLLRTFEIAVQNQYIQQIFDIPFIPASLGFQFQPASVGSPKLEPAERVDNLLDKAWRESCCKLRISSIECRPGENGSELGFARAGDWATVLLALLLMLVRGVASWEAVSSSSSSFLLDALESIACFAGDPQTSVFLSSSLRAHSN